LYPISTLSGSGDFSATFAVDQVNMLVRNPTTGVNHIVGHVFTDCGTPMFDVCYMTSDRKTIEVSGLNYIPSGARIRLTFDDSTTSLRPANAGIMPIPPSKAIQKIQLVDTAETPLAN
jgi:hypothetical protein